MSGQNSSPGFSDLSDPNDPFYADPFEPDSSDVIVDAGFVTPLDRAVVHVLDESDPGESLTFERIGRGAYEGFTLAEARAIVENPDQLAHLALLWRLRPPPAPITENSVVDDPTGRWHRELERQTQQPPPGPGRPRDVRTRAGGAGARWPWPRVGNHSGRGECRRRSGGRSPRRGEHVPQTDRHLRCPGPSTSAAPSRAVLPKSAPLALDQFVFPWGTDDQLQLYVASVTGSVAPRRLAGPANHRLYGASLSADRRSLVYIDDTEHSVRTMAVDGTGDRPLFDRLPSGCYGPGHVSLSPADETSWSCSASRSPDRAG